MCFRYQGVTGIANDLSYVCLVHSLMHSHQALKGAKRAASEKGEIKTNQPLLPYFPPMPMSEFRVLLQDEEIRQSSEEAEPSEDGKKVWPLSALVRLPQTPPRLPRQSAAALSPPICQHR